VKLADRELRVAAATQLPELAPVPVAGLEPVVVGRDVDRRREPGMGDGAVVALEEVLAGDLPVGRHLPVLVVVEDELVHVEAGGRDPVRNVSEQL
jgi:hypothetical protein